MSRLSHTVMCGKRLRSCGTCTKPRASVARGEAPVMSSPPNETEPARGRSNPLTHLSTVDFPAPFGPIRQVTWPFPTLSETPFKISPAPYPATTSLSNSSGDELCSEVSVAVMAAPLHGLAANDCADVRPG